MTTNDRLKLHYLKDIAGKTPTKREAFAAQIMAELVSASHGVAKPELIAQAAVSYADALINELNKQEGKNENEY